MISQQLITNVKKEVWEFKRTLVWLPAIIVTIAVVAILWALFNFHENPFASLAYELQGIHEANQLNELGKASIVGMTALFLPFLVVSIFIQLHYFLSCLFDERRDLSIYFWRSLPVSDIQTVLVKLFTGSFVIPGVFLTAASLLTLIVLFMMFVACIVLSVGYDVSLWAIWGHMELFSSFVVMWATLIPLFMWMFPLFAWLMLASSYASRAPFLWASVPIVIIIIVEVFISESVGSYHMYISEGLQNYFNIADALEHAAGELPPESFSEKFFIANALFSKVNLLPTLLGCGFIYGAYWLRSNKQH